MASTLSPWTAYKGYSHDGLHTASMGGMQRVQLCQGAGVRVEVRVYGLSWGLPDVAIIVLSSLKVYRHCLSDVVLLSDIVLTPSDSVLTLSGSVLSPSHI